LVNKLKGIVARWEVAGNAEKDEAKEMWDENLAHRRPQWYMLHHGEGGFYKEPKSSAEGKNKALTEQLITLAAELYSVGKQEAGLSVLSDALHQAEDRGSHNEGGEFEGHDIRQTIKDYPETATKKPPAGHYKGKNTTFTDNAAKNEPGAKMALLYAKGTLLSFLGKVYSMKSREEEKTTLKALQAGERPEPVEIKGPEVITLGAPEKELQPRERQTKFTLPKKYGGGRVTKTSSSRLAQYAGTTSPEVIKAINIEEDLKNLEDTAKEAGVTTENFQLVNKSVQNYAEAWLTSELMELIRENDKTWRIQKEETKHTKRTEIANNKFAELQIRYPELMQYITKEQKEEISRRAVLNYEYQRSSTFGATETKAEPLKELEKKSEFGEQIEVIKWDPELMNVFTTEEKEELIEIAPELMQYVKNKEEKREISRLRWEKGKLKENIELIKLDPELMNVFTTEEKKKLVKLDPELKKYLP